MYEENVKRINWTKNILKIILLVLVVILSVKLVNIIISRQTSGGYDKKYNSLLKEMDDYANDYFTMETIPDKSGESKIVYLKDLPALKKANKSCDINKSYIKAVRLDTEYEIKTYLVCEKYENSINSFKKLDKDSIKISTTKKVKKTTKKVSTTKNKTKKYKVAFNPNGGNIIDEVIISANKTLNNIPTPNREGYKFIGWYYHGNQFDINTKINQDYVLTAKWVKE